MKKVDFNKLQAGDLVEVPRTQFAPMRRECFYYASSKERKKHFEEIRNRGRRELLQIH